MRSHLGLIAIIALGLGGCAEPRMSMYAESLDAAGGGQNVIQYSLFKEDREVVGDDVIAKALDGRIEYVEKGKMAVVQVGRQIYADLGNSDRNLSIVAKGLQGNPHVGDVIRVPQLLMPTQVTIPVMRVVVSRLQCQMILIYNVTLKSDYEFNLFSKDRTRTILTLEGLVVHVKTGVIPITTVVDRTIEIEAKTEDKDRYDTIRRAEQAALEQALAEMSARINDRLK